MDESDIGATVAAGRALLLPTVALDVDLAAAFRVSRGTARKMLARGAFGPRFKVGRRWAVLKDDLLKHLAAMARVPVRTGSDPFEGPCRGCGRDLRKSEVAGWGDANRWCWPCLRAGKGQP